MKLEPLAIGGCFVLRSHAFADARGSFVKSFHIDAFERLGLRTDWREEFFTTSRADVIRGMHFQAPPAAHAKLVFCVTGRVLDVILDLRIGSPTYGRACSFELAGDTGCGVYIPAGCAHGFLSLTEGSVMYYKVTSTHAPAQDSGIAWDSFGFDWPIASPLLSHRDTGHPRFDAFVSPFRMENG